MQPSAPSQKKNLQTKKKNKKKGAKAVLYDFNTDFESNANYRTTDVESHPSSKKNIIPPTTHPKKKNQNSTLKMNSSDDDEEDLSLVDINDEEFEIEAYDLNKPSFQHQNDDKDKPNNIQTHMKLLHSQPKTSTEDIMRNLMSMESKKTLPPQSIMSQKNYPSSSHAAAKKITFQTPSTPSSSTNKKQQPFQKQKAGADIKPKMYHSQGTSSSSYSSNHDEFSSNVVSVRDTISEIGSGNLTQFYSSEKIDEMYQFMSDIIIQMKNNPFYIFATEVATNINKPETMFIHTSVQEIIKIINMSSKNTSSGQTNEKKFKIYFDIIKNMNTILKNNAKYYSSHTSGPSYTVDIDALNNLTEAQKLMYESMQNIRKAQFEMEMIKKIIIHGNIYLSSKFFFSSSILTLINTAMNKIEKTTDEYGIIDHRNYDPEKIIISKPRIRNKLAELCGHLYNRNMINSANRPTTGKDAERNANAIEETTLELKSMLSDDGDDVQIDDFAVIYNRSSIISPITNTPTTPFDQSLFPLSGFGDIPSSQNEEEYSNNIPTISSRLQSEISSGHKKRSSLSSSQKRITRYHVPKKYRM